MRLRRPEAFDSQPVHMAFDWSLVGMSNSVAWLADQIPTQVELGPRLLAKILAGLVELSPFVARSDHFRVAYF
jgi:hypothetical protein